MVLILKSDQIRFCIAIFFHGIKMDNVSLFFLAAGNGLMPGSGSLRLLFGFCNISFLKE